MISSSIPPSPNSGSPGSAGRSTMSSCLFKLSTAVSFFAFMLVAALFVRSYWYADEVAFGSSDDVLRTIMSSRGRVMLLYRESTLFGSLPWPAHRSLALPDAEFDQGWNWMAGPASSSVLGFARINIDGVPGYRGWRGCAMPDWFGMLMTFIIPARWLYPMYRQRSRAHDNLCTQCGYDLRASPYCCPECGLMQQRERRIKN